MYYQPVPPAYLAEMFSYSSAPIDSFKAMYNAANKAPSLVGCDSVTNITVNIKSYYKNNFVISPDPTSDGNISIYVPKNFALKNVSVYTSTGQLVQKIENNLMSPIQLTLPDTRGIYYVEIFDGKQVLYEKVIRE